MFPPALSAIYDVERNIFSTSWGLTRSFDKTFENGTFPPLTPQVMSYKRAEFNTLSANDTVERNGTNLSGYLSIRHLLWPDVY